MGIPTSPEGSRIAAEVASGQPQVQPLHGPEAARFGAILAEALAGCTRGLLKHWPVVCGAQIYVVRLDDEDALQ